MMVIDAHVHFWDPGVLTYPWLDHVPALGRAFLPRDYPSFAGSERAGVDAVVFVEANCPPGQSAEEVEFVERLAAAEPRIVGTVAHVDLLDDRQRTGMLDRIAGVTRVVGVRHNVQGLPSDLWLDERFVRGVQEVGRRGLTFDLCATADQLPDLARLIEQCPGTRLVLDHCGKPVIRDGAFSAWARDLERLARFENLACKLSGLYTEARTDQRDMVSLGPYADHVAQCFGAERVLYGSDWPVSTLAGPALPWRQFTECLTAAWPPADRELFYADNAIRLYGLALQGVR